MTVSRLDGRVAVVTGAGRGIGRAVAEALHARGARVAIADINGDTARRTADALGEGAFAVVGDAGRGDDVARMVAEVERGLGNIDILVNNAGQDNALSILDIDEAEWDRLMTTNLKSVFLWTKAVLPGMIAKGRGRVVSMSSLVGRQGAINGGIHYATTKAGILGFTRTLARQMAKHGITANAVAPGLIDTDLIRENVTPETRERLQQAIPLARLGATADVGNAVAFLASDEAAYITGATLDVNGGFWIG
ncbi:SDR family NAD(P)-dependent oxidoreductase [Chelatococcus asaccharovorans]|uniref:2-hydroxycyclohexanecarboxyl-CoA dehydrogenase n=1 Tax=Chelatococcus asaccharovorans TaxID=28210 RepID=A0A2V3UUU2_9HYPH|nr:glucose 1-dehydrogenase [Chelatococcus asaccharovorans]MBS7701795.1 glucose 1-dehydrogenase [Chelatococcus asaccharovorans]PXW64498.1 2-hydroxycyclohexanecarboxyl-CoA dehydrogenase [Chelatococcus asaccharovorans]